MLDFLENTIPYIYNTNTKQLLKELQQYINEYKLDKENSDGYFELRKHYNLSNKKHPMELYTLICHGFNNQIRFNSKGKFNIPFGKRDFNPALKEKFIDFVREMHNKKIVFTNENFVNLKIDKLHDNSFVYLDPPYLGSTATYNEQSGWTEEDESALLSLLNRLSERGIAWALSNNLKYKNPLLEAFLNSTEGIKVHYLGSHYTNCSYQKKDKSEDIEILVTNY